MGGTSGRVLFDNAGVLGEIAVTGTGSVALATSPTLTTPTLDTPKFTAYTWAGKPAAGTAGRQIFISDVGPKGTYWEDDGTRWKPVNGGCVLATLDAISSNVGQTETIVFQYQMPAGLLQLSDRLRLWGTITRSSTTDTASWALKLGTAGTIADAGLISGALLAATNLQGAPLVAVRLATLAGGTGGASTVQQIAGGAPAIAGSYGNVGTGAPPSAVSLGSGQTVASSLFVTVTLTSAGATSTDNLRDLVLELIAPAN